MIKQLLVMLAATTALGCSTSAELTNPFSESDGSAHPTRMAAFAARAQYPTTRPAADGPAILALVNREANSIRLLNASDQPVRDARVWVNGSFVAYVDNIPAHGSATIGRGEFFDGGGDSLAQVQASVRDVELQAGQQFYRLLGPVFE